MATKKTTKKTVKKVRGIKVSFFVLGNDPREVPVKEGTTFGEFAKAQGIEGMKTNINGSNATESYVLQAGDRITPVPNTKGGAN